MSSIELALIQHSFKGDKQNGANLVALQELHTSEYFCQREDTRFFQYAESFEREVAIFSKVARQHKIVLVTSLFEKRAKGLYHNTAVVFERDGNIIARHTFLMTRAFMRNSTLRKAMAILHRFALR